MARRGLAWRRLSRCRYRYLLAGVVALAIFRPFSPSPYTLVLRTMAGSRTPGPVSLDGSTYEGGGGLIRYAIAYASILNRPVHIHSVRAHRPGAGGLRSEHTVAVATMSELAAAVVDGNRPASRDLTFAPHADAAAAATPLPASLDVTTEGSASIFLIAMLPYLLFSSLAAPASGFRPRLGPADEVELVVRAGTLCVKAPSIFYMRQVFLPTLALVGIGPEHVRIDEAHEQGWHTDFKKYPGRMVAHVKPLARPLAGFVLTHRGPLRTIRATAHAPRPVMASFRKTLEAEMADLLANANGAVELIVDVFASVPDDQYHLLMAADTAAPVSYLGYEQVYPQKDVFPADIAGDDGKIALHLIRACIYGLYLELRRGNRVDEHLEDSLTLYMSLAHGFSSVVAKDNELPVPEMNMETPALKHGSVYEIDTESLHRETSWWMVEQMTGLRQETRLLDGRERVGCVGIGVGHVESHV